MSRGHLRVVHSGHGPDSCAVPKCPTRRMCGRAVCHEHRNPYWDPATLDDFLDSHWPGVVGLGPRKVADVPPPKRRVHR